MCRTALLRRSVDRYRVPQTLVHPIPDEAALQIWLRVNLVPVGPEIARSISHRVLILTHNVRAEPGTGVPSGGSLLHLLGIAIQLSGPRIHWADDVRVRPLRRTLIVYWPARIALMKPV